MADQGDGDTEQACTVLLLEIREHETRFQLLTKQC